MASKPNPTSTWNYGFFFNLLVAMCTVGFLCYFIYRFDNRLLRLERRLYEWDKAEDHTDMHRSEGLFGHTNVKRKGLAQEKVKNNRTFARKLRTEKETLENLREKSWKIVREKNKSFIHCFVFVTNYQEPSGIHSSLCNQVELRKKGQQLWDRSAYKFAIRFFCPFATSHQRWNHWQRYEIKKQLKKEFTVEDPPRSPFRDIIFYYDEPITRIP